MKLSRSLRALLANSIDYAGLFPPASLPLEPALKNYAAYTRSDEAWMLSTFVLPIARFAEAAWFLPEFNEANQLRLSTLASKTGNAVDFAGELDNVANGIRHLTSEGGARVRIEQLEMPLPEKTDADVLDAASDVALRSFWETPPALAEEIMTLLALQNVKKKRALGFKLRTGGVTADAFPGSGQIAHVLVASAKHNVPIKFTAGLHHPVRMFRDEVNGKMHGFLNVLGAGVLAREHSWEVEQISAMLEDEDASAFEFDDSRFRWRDWEVAAERIEQHRAFITSFGSCSFDEPREDLRILGLL